MVDATKRRVLAIGLIAGSLILWLAGSFWLDAWTQYRQAQQIQSLIVDSDRKADRAQLFSGPGSVTNAELVKLRAQLYERPHPALTRLIRFVTLKQQVFELDSSSAQLSHAISTAWPSISPTLIPDYKHAINATRLQNAHSELLHHIAFHHQQFDEQVDANHQRRLSSAMDNVSRALLDGNQPTAAILVDLASTRAALADIDSDATQFILDSAKAAQAHGLRRLLIDTVLIAICLWIGVMSQRLLAHIHHEAHYDRLTGLPNRFSLEKVMDTLLTSSIQRGQRSALILIDITNYDQTIDTVGKTIGDRHLVSLGTQMVQQAGAQAQVASFGANRFAILLKGLRDANSADSITRSIVETCEISHEIDGVTLHARLSAGISQSPDHGVTSAELIQKSELALALAASTGKDRILSFSNQLSEQQKARIQLELDLQIALAEQQFTLHYQPKVCTRTGLVKSVEALVRWEHPDRGLISPFLFISVAEECGLIGDIGAWVLNEAIRQTASWRETDTSELRVAVNVSAYQFMQDDFVEDVFAAVQRHGLPATSLELEITESVAMADISSVIAALQQLRSGGIRIAIDDFGTDYSSLKYLDDLPVNVLKIDKSFVTRLDEVDYQRSLVNTIVQMAQSLGLETVAEGVESESQILAIHKLGCDYIQGYYFAEPVPAHKLMQTIESIEKLGLSWQNRVA